MKKKGPTPSAWTEPPAASLRIVIQQPNDTRATPAWRGLTDKQARQLRQAIGQYLENRLPPDIEWSVATIVFTRRQGDDTNSVDFLSASTTPWTPLEQIQEWLDHADEVTNDD